MEGYGKEEKPMMNKQIRAMMIGAHPDDCDFRYGGLATKYVQAGHKVKFLAMCDGSGGHHILSSKEVAERRKGETQEIARLAGIEYDVWDIPDCELMADLETRKRLVHEIRKFNPDIIFCNRPNDYHVDHRNASLLVQDAAYLLIVPLFCPDVPAMKQTPVIMHSYDSFQNPPFQADVVVAIDDVLEKKIEMLACHESQMFEWLPYSKGILDQVPEGKEARIQWLHEPRIPRDRRPLDEQILRATLISDESEYREAVPAAKYRHKLIERYGEEKGKSVLFAEAFAVCEYGAPLTRENEGDYFPL